MIPSGPPSGTFDRGSFRDPASRVFLDGDLVGRVLSEQGARDWQAVVTTDAFARWTAAGDVVATEEVPASKPTILRHAPLRVWTYPYEWTFSMLREAALLQLRLLDEALDDGLTFKDATPYNVQFRGSRPIFIDIGSVRPWEQGEPWLGYRQFCQLFLYPLLLRAHAGAPFQPFLRGSLSGIPLETARAFLRGSRALKPGGIVDVMLHARAERSTKTRDVRSELTSAGFSKSMIQNNVRRLRRVIDKTQWSPDESAWSEYADCDHVGTQRSGKSAFVERALAGRTHGVVWDLGANDGHYSRIAAEHAEAVLAIDGDELVLDRLFRDLRAENNETITPVVMDASDPSPGLGWRGAERGRLEHRSAPDLVLMLAVMHHLVVGSNLPLTEIIDWAASLRAEIVFEWVPPSDPMVRQLTTNKKPWEVHADYREDVLRRLLDERFGVVAELDIDGRTLFHLQPRP